MVQLTTGRMVEPERSASKSARADAGGRSRRRSRGSAMPRLLVIDDDYLHRKIICRVAAKAGYAPAGAGTYDEATKLALENAFDCISLDLSLGQHGGIEMLYYLRGIGCKAPIVIISGAIRPPSTTPCGRRSRSIWIFAKRLPSRSISICCAIVSSASARSPTRRSPPREHDPEKRKPAFRKDHAQSKIIPIRTFRRNRALADRSAPAAAAPRHGRSAA